MEIARRKSLWRVPDFVGLAGGVGTPTGENEEEVGEPVEIGNCLRSNGLGARGTDHGAFGATGDGSCEMKRGRGRTAAWENEIAEWGKIGLEAIDVLLQRRDVCVRDARRARSGFGRRGEIRAEHEEV